MPPSHVNGIESLLSHLESNGPFCALVTKTVAAKSKVNIFFIFIAIVFSLECCGEVGGCGMSSADVRSWL